MLKSRIRIFSHNFYNITSIILSILTLLLHFFCIFISFLKHIFLRHLISLILHFRLLPLHIHNHLLLYHHLFIFSLFFYIHSFHHFSLFQGWLIILFSHCIPLFIHLLKHLLSFQDLLGNSLVLLYIHLLLNLSNILNILQLLGLAKKHFIHKLFKWILTHLSLSIYIACSSCIYISKGHILIT